MKPIALLGAGASVDAGIPTAVDMTQEMISHFQSYDGSEAAKTVEVLEFVARHLPGNPTGVSSQASQGIDIETLFAAVKMLAERETSEIAPFVALWNPYIDKLEDSKSIFTRTNDYMLRILVEMIWLKDRTKVDYLAPLVRQGANETFTIATLNYDNTIELAGETTNIPVTDGLEGWLEHGEFRKPKGGIELLKLHGSVDWSITGASIWKRDIMPYKALNRVPQEKIRFPEYRPALVFGAGNKLSAQGPFLDLLQAFKQRLEEHNELLVVGYSFRDEHINEAITQWINRSKERSITIIDRQGATENHFYHTQALRLRSRSRVQPVGARSGIAAFFQTNTCQ